MTDGLSIQISPLVLQTNIEFSITHIFRKATTSNRLAFYHRVYLIACFFVLI